MLIWIMNKRTDARKVRRRAQSVDIHILASRQKLCILGKYGKGFSFLFLLTLLPCVSLFSQVLLPWISSLTFFLPIPPLINFISPHRHANAAVLSRVAWQPQLLGNTQLSIIHSRSLTDEERASVCLPARAVVRRREASRGKGGGAQC